MKLDCKTAELELEKAEKSNPGRWAAHSRYVAMACKNIAHRCGILSADEAYILGLLHDIGRYGLHSATIDRWKKLLEIKAMFEEKTGCSIYDLLPGVIENSFR